MPDKALAAERDALRHLLDRLENEVTDLETLCKHLPRIVSVATTAARVQAALDTAADPDFTNTVLQAIRDLDAEEEPTW